MSFDINWDKLVADGVLNTQIKDFLDNQFKSLSLPSFINNLSVENFDLGTIPPEITIRHIGDPFPDFYESEPDGNEDEDNTEANTHKSPNKSEQEYQNSNSAEPIEYIDKDCAQSLNSKNDLSSISEEHENMNSSETQEVQPEFDGPQLLQSRPAQDSISLLIGPNHLNYLQNYNMNNVGIGYLSHEPSNYTGLSSPKTFLSHNRLNSTTTPSPPITMKAKKFKPVGENDIQLIAEVNYKGDLKIELSVSLLLNYPSPNFISLPIKLQITNLEIHSIASIAYLDKAMYLSFLCDIDDSNAEYFAATSDSSNSASAGGNIVDYFNFSNRERIDIIKNIKIESEIGETENNVLRNVGKVEKFLVDQLRSVIRDELAWPGWICFDLNNEPDENLDQTKCADERTTKI